jgi:hypothetical protein
VGSFLGRVCHHLPAKLAGRLRVAAKAAGTDCRTDICADTKVVGPVGWRVLALRLTKRRTCQLLLHQGQHANCNSHLQERRQCRATSLVMPDYDMPQCQSAFKAVVQCLNKHAVQLIASCSIRRKLLLCLRSVCTPPPPQPTVALKTNHLRTLNQTGTCTTGTADATGWP